ncbi:MAG: NCS2 family permease, partial [Alistipes sp.]|nr:NCS2 family permease [Alistipes sp.]
MLTKLFGFDPKNTTVRTEIIAGLTTFLTMAYILAVNPAILGDAGMDKGALFTTTALISAIATLLMAVIAKLPFALAPGMGLNAFFAYTICLAMGYSWQFALTAVFLEGVIFILLTVTNLREMMVYCLSDSIKNAISVGIGMFIAYIGLQNAGIIVGNSATQVTLGDIGAATPILAIAGTIITAVLLVKNIKGALLIGILLITIIGIPCGITTMQGVISTPPSIEPIFCKIEWSNIFTTDMLLVVCTLLFLDLFDTMGTLIGVCNKANIYTPDGKIPRLKQAFLVDALATTLGAVMGTSTVTTFAESATGVSEGGRSGLTAFVTAMCFLVALVFAPLFLSIPSAATAPVLILVGVMMMGSVTKIDFTNFADAVPAFVCIIFMPLSYSISNGILFGHLAFVAINLCSGNHKRVTTGMIVLAIIFLLRFLL